VALILRPSIAFLKPGFRAALAAAIFAGLAACAGFSGEEAPPPRPSVQAPPIVMQPPPQPEHQAPAGTPPARDMASFYTPKHMGGRALIRVALLLPFNSSRENIRALSNALYNAAQLSLFEFNNPDILLMPKATGGNAAGAQHAAQEAIGEGADLILGPLFAEEVTAIAPITQAAQVPVVAFSSDSTVAGNGIYLLSFPPDQDVHRIVDYAALNNLTSFAALIPEGDYGNRVRAAFVQAVADHGARVVALETYPPRPEEMNAPVKRLASYDSRHWALAAKRKELKAAGNTQELKALEKRDTVGDVAYQAVFVPEGGAELRALAPLLPYYDIDPRKVKFLGTGLWDDPSLTREPALEGGWFPAPPSEAHAQFVERYRRVYGAEPPRIASLAYDAVSLAVALSAKPEGERFSDQSLTTPDGFAGVDGIFRFLPGGQTERGLAVMEMRPGGAVVADPAPASFAVPPSL
jgi:ABC-type branched-subunit amino acid transport system substrate-binding protein